MKEGDLIKTKTKLILLNVFQDIEKAIEETKSDVPIPIAESRFLKRYYEIKRRYLK